MKKTSLLLLITLFSFSGLSLFAGGSAETATDNTLPVSIGGVIIAEPDYSRNVGVAYGGEDLDTSVPGSYGYMEEEGDRITIYDYDGMPFTFTKGSVKRIINLWPANTAGALALGAEEFFVAKLDRMVNPWQELMFPRYSTLENSFPPAAGPANVEALMALEPDLIIGHPTNVESLRTAGYNGRQLPVININFTTYQEMKVTYRVLGIILGGEVQERGEAWGRMLQENIDRVQKGLSGTSVRPVVYYTSGGASGLDSTMSSSANSVVMNEWTSYAGGKYWPELMRVLKKDIFKSRSIVNVEMILKYPPQKIFIGGGRNTDVDAVLSNTDPSTNPWAGVIADLGEENIRYMPYALFDWGRFGAESVLQILWAAVNIHPEIFADPKSDHYIDMVGETKTFYTDFVGFPITDAQVDDILNGRLPGSTGN
ncbi:MAG: ABC transporter substrate-binding protein [Spirochaetales bacterium]|nr:ABC transporter substrate-binding protein [Spirochaetales bacterium]